MSHTRGRIQARDILPTSWGLFFAGLLGLLLPGPAQGRVEVAVTHIGFPTIRGGDVVRAGQWAPIIVDLDLVDQATFDGTLRASQADLDGDECYDRVEVHLRLETGGSQRYYLYVPVNIHFGRGRFPLELLDAEGEAVEVLSQGVLTYRPDPAQYAVPIPDDDILILSVSTGVVGHVRDLVTIDNQDRIYTRAVRVAHLSPRDLPEHWIGLEAVDFLVWDEARPEELTQKQLSALLEWVEQGGTLLIAASRFAGSFKLSKSVDAVLPAEIGDVVAVDNLRDIRGELLDPPHSEDGIEAETDDWLDDGFPSPVSVIRCTPRSGAEVIAYERAIDSAVIVRSQQGRGHIIFSAVALVDLFSGEGGAVGFFEKVFHLTRMDNVEEGPPAYVSLFHNVASAVSFSTKASAYLFLAGMSSVLYVIIASFGTWGFLRAKGLQRHSWTTFAIVAFVAGTIAVVVVNSLQGFGESLHQISIVDAGAGDTYGRAVCLFGLKTSADRELDVWLPPDPLRANEPGATNNFLRPLPTGIEQNQTPTSFADPQEYRLVPASAVIDNVRLRATLKQFEGRWNGPLRGRLTGQVTIEGRNVTEDSYIVNDLGVELDPCYLIHAVLDIGEIRGVRDNAIYAYEIGPVASDGLKTLLAPRCYRAVGSETVRDILTRSRLVEHQGRWSRKLQGLFAALDFGSTSGPAVALGEERTALLLLSTVGEVDPATIFRGPYGGPRTISRDRLRFMDLREYLRLAGTAPNGEVHKGSAVIIGFADDPGPVRLFRREGDDDYAALHPDPGRSWTMYRIWIPTELPQAGKAVPDTAEDAESEARG